MTYSTKPLFFAACLSLAWAVSCTSSSQQEQQESSATEQPKSSPMSEKIQSIVYEVPTPSEIPYIIQGTGAGYNEALINDIKRIDQYTFQLDKSALNLGVYATDIGYLSSYDKAQQAINYMSSSKKLIDFLNVSGTLDERLIRDFERNISNRDSLAFLLDGTIQKTGEYLRNGSQDRLAALITTGSFVEGLYISTQLVSTYPKDILPDDSRNLILTPVINLIIKQEKSVGELISMLQQIEDDESVNSLIAEMEALQGTYKKLNIQEQIRNNRADLVLSDATLKEITELVAKTRARIVG